MLEADEGDDSESSDSEDDDDVERELGGEVPERRRRHKSPNPEEGVDWAKDIDADDESRQLLSFDIYLKGNVSKSTSFFKTAGKEGRGFRMFPFVEKRRRVDEYGEVLDVGMWLRRGKIMEDEAESDEGGCSLTRIVWS